MLSQTRPCTSTIAPFCHVGCGAQLAHGAPAPYPAALGKSDHHASAVLCAATLRIPTRRLYHMTLLEGLSWACLGSLGAGLGFCDAVVEQSSGESVGGLLGASWGYRGGPRGHVFGPSWLSWAV
eukprot:8096002-Pyramimonas_sp.AAC.1